MAMPGHGQLAVMPQGAVYVAINNKGKADDRLTGAFTDHSAMAMVHQSELVDGVATMRMAGEINIPAGSRIEMVPAAPTSCSRA